LTGTGVSDRKRSGIPMTTQQVVLLIAAILIVEALIWIPVLFWLRRRSTQLAESMRQEALLSGERFVIEPESALYRGGTGGFSFVKGNGVIALTDKRVLFRKAVGGPIEAPLSEIADVSENKWFLRSYMNGRTHVILHLRDGRQIGFFVGDHEKWMDALRSVTTPGPSVA
jgi:hypothetical protein